ncbi:hypothetical protein N658DRAFT_440231 [Parathielavia hyrcaniae]|uniref:Uncharacterized protein n=1 Tax=Parathielavia hyrcaniae TaxID=113614 RepID=A0AAN6T5X5_9PEZI|nr:hypothetical protein N658DRAFT_440231 [Parathielavia hyrcaniae]
MDESTSRPHDGNTTKAAKDKKCPYCHQAFTSSSLGRHLDLYIREKNPKAPDGLHDVEAIRKIRENITRRQPKGAVPRRSTSVSVRASSTAPRKSPVSGDADSSAAKSPLSQREGSQSGSVTANRYPFKPRWEATGVINGLQDGSARDADGDGPGRGSRFGSLQRDVSRQTLKQQLDMRQQIQDAQDRARAAELALRELLGSLRAAKQHIDIDSMPFDFDPFSLDFPALTLQCLEPPPTLFASTQHPTPTSWSILPPGRSQLEALHVFFQKEFKGWKVACAAATTVVTDELTYPPAPSTSAGSATKKAQAQIRKAEQVATKMEKHVYDHLEATYAIWGALAQEQREQLWRLELARGVGRKQKQVDRLREGQHLLRQENTNLKMQLEQLTSLRQPQDFKIALPSTIFVDEKLMARVVEEGLEHRKELVGLNITSRDADLSTLVSSAIDRWKHVVVETRSASGGLGAQRPLDTCSTGEPSPESSTGGACLTNQQQPAPSYHQPPRPQYPSTISSQSTRHPSSAASTSAALTPRLHATPAVPSTAPSTSGHGDEDEDEVMSEQDAESDADSRQDPDQDGDAEGDTDADADADADADMDDDSGDYAAAPHRVVLQQHPHQLHSAVSVPYTR